MPEQDPIEVHAEDLRFLARWAERMSRLYASLAARYDRFPGALVVGQQHARAAVQELLQRHRLSVPGTAADADAWVASHVLTGGAAAADLIDGSLAGALRVLDAALLSDLDNGTRIACRKLYAEILRQERLVRDWSAQPGGRISPGVRMRRAAPDDLRPDDSRTGDVSLCPGVADT